MAVWLHCLDMTLSLEKEALGSLVQSRHIRGCLLSYFLVPGTSNISFEEVITRVLQENYEWHEKRKQHSRASLLKYSNQ